MNLSKLPYLPGRSLWYPGWKQTGSVIECIIWCFFRLSTINHKYYIIDSDTGLSHVCSQNDFPNSIFWFIKYQPLFTKRIEKWITKDQRLHVSTQTNAPLLKLQTRKNSKNKIYQFHVKLLKCDFKRFIQYVWSCGSSLIMTFFCITNSIN